MSDAIDILNPNNPLLDSEEEDDDFEPEVPITNDGLFVKTRSGKGGTSGILSELEDVDDTLKRNARSIFIELQREENDELNAIRKKQRIGYGFKNLTTKEKDGVTYFKNLLSSSDSLTKPEACETTNDINEIKESINKAILELNQANAKTTETKRVKFAGETIEVQTKKADTQSLDTLVKSLEEKKTISTIDKSSYDWDKFKDKEGIKEEVENAKKDGYLDKQEFLNRVDYRIFEKERDQRELERIKREAERRSHQH